MHLLAFRTLAATAGVAGAVALLLALGAQRSGTSPLRVPWTTSGVAIVLGLLALWFAYPVKQYLAGKRPRLDPIRAARVVVFAQASAYTGAIMFGGFLAYAAVLFPDWGHEPRRTVIIMAAVAALAGLLLSVCGWIAENWCRIDPTDSNDATAPSGTLAT